MLIGYKILFDFLINKKSPNNINSNNCYYLLRQLNYKDYNNLFYNLKFLIIPTINSP